MTELVISMLVYFGFMSWITVQIAIMARKREVVFVILYLLPLLCVDAARDPTAGMAGSYLWPKTLNLIATLAANFVLNSYLVTILGWLEFGTIGRNAPRSRKLLGSMIVGLFLSYVYLFEKIGLHDTLSGAETHRFSDALYFVVATFTTVGYGDVIPRNHLGRALAGIASLNAYLVLAILVSTWLPGFLKQQGLRVEKQEPGNITAGLSA